MTNARGVTHSGKVKGNAKIKDNSAGQQCPAHTIS